MNSDPAQNHITYDTILEKRIGFGKYQLKTLGTIGFIDFVDGAQFLFITLLVAILKKQWDLSQSQLQILVSTYFVGGFIGALFSGIVADTLGRKKALIIGVMLEMCIILYTAFINNIITMIIVRLCYGFVIGATLPIGMLIVSEQSPNYIRGRAYLSLHFFFVLGKLYLLLLASIFLVSLSEGNWRAIALINVGPCFLMFLGTIFILDESARYLFINSRYNEAIPIMN